MVEEIPERSVRGETFGFYSPWYYVNYVNYMYKLYMKKSYTFHTFFMAYILYLAGYSYPSRYNSQ